MQGKWLYRATRNDRHRARPIYLSVFLLIRWYCRGHFRDKPILFLDWVTMLFTSIVSLTVLGPQDSLSWPSLCSATVTTDLEHELSCWLGSLTLFQTVQPRGATGFPTASAALPTPTAASGVKTRSASLPPTTALWWVCLQGAEVRRHNHS
jgi:hypothetical protein